MSTTNKGHADYWRANLRLMFILLAIWFAARIVMHGQLARPGNENRS